MSRCPWAVKEPEVTYHDTEWGFPLTDSRNLFEFLILEGAQAGLSWTTILKKREGYRTAFDGFDPEKIARYDDAKVASLLANPGIVRNRLKVAAAVKNARGYLAVCEEFPSFAHFIWQFVDHTPVNNHFTRMEEVPTETAASVAMSKELKRRGFTFVGSTICYAFMQATGMVNDHLVSCPRHAEVRNFQNISERFS